MANNNGISTKSNASESVKGFIYRSPTVNKTATSSIRRKLRLISWSEEPRVVEVSLHASFPIKVVPFSLANILGLASKQKNLTRLLNLTNTNYNIIISIK